MKYIIFYLEICYNGIFNRKKYDIVYVHFPILVAGPLLLINFFRQRMVLNFHGSDLYPNTVLKKIFNPLQRRVVNKAIAIVVPSVFFKREVQAHFNLHEDKILVYPSSGINSSVFYKFSTSSRQSLRQKLNYNVDTLSIGFASNFIAGKGWTILLDAIKLLSDSIREDFNVTIIGDGPDRKMILAKIKYLGLNNKIFVLDSMDQKQLAKYYNIFDVFVFPTTIAEESLGLVGLEAMACGTPVIGSYIAGLKGYLEDQSNGFFFVPGDANDLFLKLITYLQLSRERKEKMSNAAEKTAIPYDTTSVNVEMANFLKNLYYG